MSEFDLTKLKAKSDALTYTVSVDSVGIYKGLLFLSYTSMLKKSVSSVEKGFLSSERVKMNLPPWNYYDSNP